MDKKYDLQWYKRNKTLPGKLLQENNSVAVTVTLHLWLFSYNSMPIIFYCLWNKQIKDRGLPERFGYVFGPFRIV